MIGHWLLQLSPDAEDALLTHALGGLNSSCVVTTAAGAWICGNVMIYRPQRAIPRFSYQTGSYLYSVPGRYDDLVERFGVARVAAAIRTRVLTNQARRVIGQGVPAPAGSLSGPAATPPEEPERE